MARLRDSWPLTLIASTQKGNPASPSHLLGRRITLPDTPTIAESGLAGFDTSAWFALLAPKTTTEAVRAEIERAAIAALTAPDTRERLRAAGIDVTADGSIALQKHIGDETQMWRTVISKAGVKVE